MKLSFVRIFILHKLASTFSSLNIIRGSNHLIITLQRYDYYLDKNKLSRMNKLNFALITGLLLLVTHNTIAKESNLLLWYKQPAKTFEQALPLGNGRLGVMVYGGIEKEIFNINEETLWGGGPADNNPNPNAPGYLQKVRDELFAGQWQQASRTLRNMQGPNVNSYLPLADITLEQDIKGTPMDYIRTLDLNTAVATTSFTADGVKYERELFVSAPAQMIVIKLKASKKGRLGFSLGANTQYEGWSMETIGNNEFILNGQAPYNVNTNRNIPMQEESKNGQKGMRYQLRIRAVSTDGKGVITAKDGLNVSDATEVILFVSAATSFNGFQNRPDTQGRDEGKIASDYLNAAAGLTYSRLLKDHIADYRRYFSRVNLHLGTTDATSKKLSTEERLQAYKNGATDPDFEVLYFQFGRYLLISSSRPGGVPANLQGIWNNKQRPSWGSNYTTNINVQMNYWPALMLNLPEMNQPLIDQIERWETNGREITKNFYQMNGWTVHHNSDIWAVANPVQGDPKYANWSLGAPWLCQHLFWHYLYTMDKDFLRNKAYPLMKGAAEFCNNWLIFKDGHYITAPSTSPENVFIDDNGNQGVVTISSTMDIQIIWDLYNNLIEASEALAVDEDLRKEWIEKRDKLYPLRIGKNGNLMEWYGDWEDQDPQHRHVSHLFGLHPGRQISPLTTPDLARAAEKTLQVRGDGGTGWSKAWKINFWARLLDGNHAYKMFRELLSTSTLTNLFDTHPPFQIDGNFGGISGIGEMLLQSHLGELHLLPAIPKDWKAGKIEGMLARGGFSVNIEWKESLLYKARITAKTDNKCVIRTNVPVSVKNTAAESRKEGEYYLTTFNASKGKTYIITKI